MITLTCLVDHLFTQIPDQNFKLAWSYTNSATSFRSDDGSYGLIVQRTKKLEDSDNGREVSCILTLYTGERFSESQTILCMYIFNLLFLSKAYIPSSLGQRKPSLRSSWGRDGSCMGGCDGVVSW